MNKNISLKDTIIIPANDETTIQLNGSSITAPAGMPAISATGCDKSVLSIVGPGNVNGGKGTSSDSSN